MSVTVHTNLHPPSVVPKAPDKRDCHVVDDQSVKVHIAPQMRVVDGVENHPLNQRDMYMHHCVTHVTHHVMQHMNVLQRGEK